MTEKEALIKYCLRIADSSLILGQRMSEWCSKGPTLEEDIALSNISLDLFGQARMLLNHTADLMGDGATEDTLAFRRSERQFYNRLITERPNGNFGETVVRNFLFDVFSYLYYTKLKDSTNETLSAFAAKSLKEVTYHMRHNGEWIVRLGDGTEESHNKVQKALNDLWPYTGNMFEMNEVDTLLIEKGIAVDLNSLKEDWTKIVSDVLKRGKLNYPEDCYMQTGSEEGLHSEHFGLLLTDMQYIQRAYPDAKW